MSKFELTPRTLRLGALVLGGLIVSGLIANVVITMSQKESITPRNSAASAAGNVEILTPAGSRSTVIQTAPSRPTAPPPHAASQLPDNADNAAASESDAANNGDMPPAPPRHHTRPQQHRDNNAISAAPKPHDDQGATPVEPIRSAAPRNEAAPDAPKPSPAKKKDGLDNLF